MAGGLLTLDLSTHTGWSVWDGADDVRYGTLHLPKTGEDVGRFLCAFEDWLLPFVRMEQPKRLVFEAPILASGKTNITTARKLMCLAGETEKIATRCHVQAWEVHNGQVRKHFCGIGKARDRATLKQLTIDACRARGWNPGDDNAADALAVLDFAAHCLRMPVSWSAGPLYSQAVMSGGGASA